MTEQILVGDRVELRPINGVGTVRYIEDGAACVKWDGLSKIYTYELERLHRAPVAQPRLVAPAWAVKLQRFAR